MWINKTVNSGSCLFFNIYNVIFLEDSIFSATRHFFFIFLEKQYFYKKIKLQ